MGARTIKTGVGTYRRADDGQWTFGTLGEVVEVHSDDVERFDRLNVVPGVEAAVVREEAADAEAALDADAEVTLVRPARAGSKAAWVEYAIAQGAAPDEAEALTRDDLVEKFGG